jgi:septal ring factor EnvC (AmiA/AmiB activator)
MARSKRSVKKATPIANPTETSECEPHVNDDVTGNLAEPDVLDKNDFQRLLSEKENSILELQRKFQLLTFQFNGERSKCKELTKERVLFKSTCKLSANQEVERLKQTIVSLKDTAKSADKSKKELLASKDVRYKETFALYQKNMKLNLGFATREEASQKKINLQITNISTLNGDLMSKIRVIDAFKKDLKALQTMVTGLQKKKTDFDHSKHEHTLEMRRLANEKEQLKERKTENSNALKEKTNNILHKRKLATMEFAATQREMAKVQESARKQKAKQAKFNHGSDQMGVLHGELRKQVASNGGTVPNPGTTPLGSVS